MPSRAQRLIGTIMTLGRYGWLIVAVACLWLGYMVIWQRGLYTDDYSKKNVAVNVVTGQRHIVISSDPDRKLSRSLATNLSGLMPTYELPIRVLLAATVGINALLLALLVWRVTRSKVASLICGWLFLMPITAAEAVLWLTAACVYLSGMLFALLFLHACCSACEARGSARAWGVCAALFFVAALACVEQTALTIGLVPLIGVAVAAPGSGADRRLILKRCLALVLVPLAVTAVAAVAYRSVPNVQIRGGMNTSVSAVLQRIPVYLSAFELNTIAPNWGRRRLAEAFGLGRQVLAWSKRAKLALAVALLGLALVVLTWRRHADAVAPRAAVFLALFAVGIVWLFVALVFPASLLTSQIYEARFTYIPLAGAAAACGAAGGLLGWLSRRLLGKTWGETAAVGIAGVALILTSIVILGYGWTFAERSRVDRQQLSAFMNAIPAANLPKNAVVVPWQTDKGVLSSLGLINQAAVGVFETNWSAAGALQAAYQRKDISAVTANRWTTMQFAVRSPADQARNQIRIQNKPVPIDRTIFFTYQGGIVYPVLSLTLKAPDGSQDTVSFPIAAALRAAGVPTRKNIVVQAR